MHDFTATLLELYIPPSPAVRARIPWSFPHNCGAISVSSARRIARDCLLQMRRLEIPLFLQAYSGIALEHKLQKGSTLFTMKRKNRRNNPSNEPRPTSEEIATTAYHLYVESGLMDGHDLEHWLRAEQLLIEKLKSPAQAQNAKSEPAQIREGLQVRTKALASESNGVPLLGKTTAISSTGVLAR